MPTAEVFTVEIDQLPVERIEAADAQDAARKVAAMIGDRAALRGLDDAEPVQIKRADGRAWGRNLTVGVFRRGAIDAAENEPDGPVHPPSI